MKLKRSPSPLEQAEHWIMHWRRSLDSKLYDSDEWKFANDQLNSWIDRRRELEPISAGQR
jgi:hypothetical protein